MQITIYDFLQSTMLHAIGASINVYVLLISIEEEEKSFGFVMSLNTSYHIQCNTYANCVTYDEHHIQIDKLTDAVN